MNRHGSTPTYPAATMLPGARASALGLPESSRPLAKIRRSAFAQHPGPPQSRPAALETVAMPAAIYRIQDGPKLKSP